MGRLPRKNQNFCFHHVMVRGNNKQVIFFSDKDYFKALEFFQESLIKYRAKAHLFCLMSNHMHFLIETSDIPLKRIMQSFLSKYAKWLNYTYEKVGHLFQERYKAKRVITDSYFFELIYYIHNNPVAAGITDTMHSYKWSSHTTYSKAQIHPWINTSYLKNLIRKKYKSYDEFIRFFKSTDFKPEFCEINQFDELEIIKDSLKDLDYRLKFLGMFSFQEICKVICSQLNFDPNKLDSVSQSKQSCAARAIISYFAHFYASIPLNYIGLQFERDPATLSRNMYRFINSADNSGIIDHMKVALTKAIASKQLVLSNN